MTDPRVPADLRAVMALLRPFGDAVKEAGFDVQIQVRERGKSTERLAYRSGGYVTEAERDDPLCPDDRVENQ